MEIFAQRVKELRKEHKKTQKEVAQYLGVGLRAYQFYESATNYPNIPGLIKLADFFDVSTDYLLGRSQERK
nr:helix-turn-helix transcriptional regulator [uncultured Oscillibacter sp.]